MGPDILQSKRFYVAALVLAMLGYFWFFHRGLSPGSGRVGNSAMILGTWTNERGEAGNRIRFYLVRCELPTDSLGLLAYEGRADFQKQFGKENLQATWNHECSDPLRLNIFIDRYHIAAIAILDPDHLRIRFAERPEQVYGTNPFEHADTMLLTRVQEPAP